MPANGRGGKICHSAHTWSTIGGPLGHAHWRQFVTIAVTTPTKELPMMPVGPFARIVAALVILGFSAHAVAQDRAVDKATIESRELRAALAAHHICSGLWVTGRNYQRTPEEVVAQDIAPFKYTGWEPDFKYEVDYERKTVTVTAPGAPPRTAKYNGDQGSTILPIGAKDVFFKPVRVSRNLPPADK